ncbi:3-hydroxyacyl-CoA dehydrogenase NAD-binding domain-containing protein [Paracnuella aquatica]|uniref:3-hydroxyacyl-CoA dehydrogenase NAD-binding domain-containing protein n=1 Tax=Paracnuella aquatica TaxID=2268757 RepID=UPI000DEFE098|nr:3-hydroxyacyl-CoA dehydrogenase NAD-binding domain-containing protein [Paracnuella aquatica]RPD46042.1 3-hydroxybutyryl-CoA dehydrogenase [Paracnuella aquatica]
MNIETIAVCGAGTMGRGIAQVCATAGFATILFEPNSEVLRNAKEAVHSSLQALAAKGKIGAPDEILNRIFFTQNLSDCTAQLVIEAIVEQPAAKVGLFTQLATINDAATIFASNTSSLSISELANNLPHPDRFAGLHFFNPAPLMKLVEVVAGAQTDPEVIKTLEALVARLGKTSVACTDAPGFIVNRVARPFYIEALRQAEAGVEMETIDRLMEARGFKMGPFRLMDLIGNDVNYAVSCSVWEQLQQPERLRPSPLQQEKVEAGHLGKKSGKGYYTYDKA